MKAASEHAEQCLATWGLERTEGGDHATELSAERTIREGLNMNDADDAEQKGRMNIMHVLRLQPCLAK